ncbi:hypothetical protein ACO1PF_00195 [Alkalibacterium sp. f15]|uniref:hypothetical protein n=1 Tax=Alkalibacterium sp. f15 TaxID=3414029 RepID=UPI003BF8A946
MNKNRNKLNFAATFMIAMIGSLMPLIRAVIRERFAFTAVESHNYVLVALGLMSFLISFQIVEWMKITKKKNEYYLSILGVHFITTMILMMFVSVGYALLA